MAEPLALPPLRPRPPRPRPPPRAAVDTAPPPPPACTFVPASSRSWPSVTIVWPALQALFDHDVVADALADADRLLIDGAVALHDEDELAVLSGLHGLARARRARAESS